LRSDEGGAEGFDAVCVEGDAGVAEGVLEGGREVYGICGFEFDEWEGGFGA
jgi:hypothetical protein